MDSLVPGTQLILDQIAENLRAKAWEFQNSAVKAIESMDEIPKDETKGASETNIKEDSLDLRVYSFGWCGCDECGHKFEDEHDIKILGTPYLPGDEYDGKCIVCGKPTKLKAYAARTM